VMSIASSSFSLARKAPLIEAEQIPARYVPLKDCEVKTNVGNQKHHRSIPSKKREGSVIDILPCHISHHGMSRVAQLTYLSSLFVS
jgi:hypothetical protein